MKSYLYIFGVLFVLCFFSSIFTVAATMVWGVSNLPIAPRHWLAQAPAILLMSFGIPLHMYSLSTPTSWNVFRLNQNWSPQCKPEHAQTVEGVMQFQEGGCSLQDYHTVTMTQKTMLVQDQSQYQRLFLVDNKKHFMSSCADASVSCFLWQTQDVHEKSPMHISHLSLIHI